MAVLTGYIRKVEHDVGTGWYGIGVESTDHPDVKKLTTKMEAKAREAAAFRQSGELLDITYSPKQRHDQASGRTYNNNYYESAKVHEEIAATNGDVGGIDVVQPQGRKTNPADAWRMALSTGAKLAVQTLPMLKAESQTPEAQQRVALWWATWIFTTPPPERQPESELVHAGPGAYDDPGFDRPPPSDDDIPF